MRIGFIGLGNMGRPMATSLLRSGFDVTVFNRTPSRTARLAELGARVAASPAELTGGVDIVLTCLGNVAASREIFLAEGGLADRARAGQILVDHSTVDPSTSRDIAASAAEQGAFFLDAPISGGPDGARDATLAIMVGGDETAFDRALPILRSMGRTVRHMGPSGAGTATKLANQLLVGVHSLASCEALRLALGAGVDPEKLLDILENSWGASRMLERNAPGILAGSFGPSPVPLRNLVKDLSIITALGQELGLDLKAAAVAERAYAALDGKGRGEWDITAACLLVDPHLEAEARAANSRASEPRTAD